MISDDVGGNKSALCRVLIEWTSKLRLNSFIFLTINNTNDSISQSLILTWCLEASVVCCSNRRVNI